MTVLRGAGVLALLLASAPLNAQSEPEPVSTWRPLRIAKWTSLTGTGALALYGFSSNRRADELYEGIERVCAVDPVRCVNRHGDGSYADEALEADFQRIRGLDKQARRALLASQIGLAASAVMFILDLRNQRPPDNIPYEPRRIDIGPSPHGGLHLSVRLPLDRSRGGDAPHGRDPSIP